MFVALGAPPASARLRRAPVTVPRLGAGPGRRVKNRVSLYQPFRCSTKYLELLCAAAKNAHPKGLIKGHAKKGPRGAPSQNPIRDRSRDTFAARAGRCRGVGQVVS